MIWHSHTADEALLELNTDIAVGLSSDAAAARLQEYGENRLADKPSTVWRLFIRRMKSVAAILPILVAAIALGVSAYGYITDLTPIEWVAPAVTSALVILGAILGAMQDLRGETELRALRDLSALDVLVRRDGQRITVPAYTLVPGDILELKAGDRAPADCRLAETHAFTCDESALTKGAVAVSKDADSVFEDITSLSERTNMMYAGSAVTSGEAVAIVVATGVRSEMGHAAAKPQGSSEKGTSLRERMVRIHKLVSLLTLGVCAVLVIVALLLRVPLMTALTMAAALVVAASPDGLITAVTLALTRGVRRSAEQNAVIRRSAVVETLGNVTVLVTDEAALTPSGEAELTRAFVSHQTVTLDGSASATGLPQLLQLAALCTDAANDNPTDAAIIAYADRVGMDRARLLEDMPRVGEFPYDTGRGLMTAVHRAESAAIVIVKGEPEAVFSRCTRGHIDEAEDACAAMAKDELKAVAVAYKILREPPAVCTAQELECGLTLAGLLGIAEPLPTDALEAIVRCESEGIRPVIITKNPIVAACSAARKLGLLQSDDEAVTGDIVANMSDEELNSAVARCRVYVQMASADTVRVIEAFKRCGDIVAFTGRRAEDVPALRAANVGCAMRSGADVAKDTADVVLTDDRFDSVVAAVREGSGIRAAVRKTIHLLISCRLGGMLAVIATALIWRASPLLPLHLLWLNLITALLSAPTLGVEPPAADTLTRAPRRAREALLPRRIAWQAVAESALFAALALIACYVGAVIWENATLGATMAFATLAIIEALHPLIVRTSRSVFVTGFGERSLLWALGASLAAIVAVLLIPGVQSAFSLVGMNAAAWGVTLCLAVEPLIITEAVKGIRKIIKK